MLHVSGIRPSAELALDAPLTSEHLIDQVAAEVPSDLLERNNLPLESTRVNTELLERHPKAALDHAIETHPERQANVLDERVP